MRAAVGAAMPLLMVVVFPLVRLSRSWPPTHENQGDEDDQDDVDDTDAAATVAITVAAKPLKRPSRKMTGMMIRISPRDMALSPINVHIADDVDKGLAIIGKAARQALE